MARTSSGTRRPRGSWIKCSEVRGDRDRVVRAVREVGHSLPLFTTGDVNRHLSKPKFGGLRKGQLSRHLAALDGDMIIQVDDVAVSSPVGSSYRVWALRARRHELSQHVKGFGPVTDPERAFYALHVAAEVLGQPTVFTADVTAVLQEVLDLRLDHDQDTNPLLSGLARRDDPPVKKISRPDERWVRWEPLREVTHPRFRHWVEIVERSATGRSGLGSVSHACYSEVARELVSIAIEETTCVDYPYGRPVRVFEIAELAGRTVRGMELLRVLTENGIHLATLLGDVTKTRLHGTSRVTLRVKRVHGPRFGNTYYDVPGLHGAAGRRHLPEFWDIRRATAENQIAEILGEYRAASHFLDRYDRSGPALTGIVLTRRFLAAMELDDLRHALRSLQATGPELSTSLQKDIDSYLARVSKAARSLQSLRSLEEEAREALSPLGLTLEEVAGSERPRVFPGRWDGWFTEFERGDLSAAEHLAGSTTLHRYRNPEFRSRSASEDAQRCTTYVDMVEALPLAATVTQAAVKKEVSAGARLLGRNLRHPGLLHPLLEHPDLVVRRDAFFALVLLDDAAVRAWIELRMDDPAAPRHEVIWALHAAVALGCFEPDRLRPWLRDPQCPHVTDAVQSAVMAYQYQALSR